MEKAIKRAEGASRLSSWVRFALFVVLVGLSVAVLLFSPLREFIELERLHDALARLREHPAAPVLFLIGFSCLSLLGSPVVPLIVAGAAVFGFGKGLALNLVGVVLGSSCSYWLARGLGRDLSRRLLGSRYAALESLIRRRGFWPMVRLRFLPIPFPVANCGPALLGVGYPLFLVSTALAYVPILVVYGYFAATILSAGESERGVILNRLGLSVVLLLLLTLLPPRIVSWSSGRRRRRDGGEAGGEAGREGRGSRLETGSSKERVRLYSRNPTTGGGNAEVRSEAQSTGEAQARNGR